MAQICLFCLWGLVCFQGAVLINDAARIVDRHMHFQEGLAYGIDQLLEPPGLGAHCDMLENRTTYVSKLVQNLTGSEVPGSCRTTFVPRNRFITVFIPLFCCTSMLL